MHMSDALVSAAVGTTMAVASTGAIGYSIKKVKNTELYDNQIPMMGVMGAFVFAAQMINFTIPVTGSSGHIGGGVLLAALLGPFPAFLTLTSVLLIQALFFADGGLLALGCNIFNMGVLSCLIAYPLIYKPLIKKSMTPKRITIASILTVVIGLQLGSLAVVVETAASNVVGLPFTVFLAPMQLIHLAIGAIEGIITGAVLCFIYRTRSEVLLKALDDRSSIRTARKKVLIIFIIATVIVGGGLSLYASSKPDGLEWSIQGILGEKELDTTSKLHNNAKELQENTAVLPDYAFKEGASDNQIGTSVSGIVGAFLTLAVTVGSGVLILNIKKKKLNKVSAK